MTKADELFKFGAERSKSAKFSENEDGLRCVNETKILEVAEMVRLRSFGLC